MPVNPLERVGITSDMIANLEVTPEDAEAMHSWYPLTGRYANYTRGLNKITSEYEWNRRRLWAGVEYMIALGDELASYGGEKKKVIPRPFSGDEKSTLRKLYDDGEEGFFDDMMNRLIKLADDTIHQDVVAMERVAVYTLSENGFDPEMAEAAFHYARTSNDINSLVFNSMIRDCLSQVYVPSILDLGDLFIQKADEWGEIPFAGQTHGQYAVPTTLKRVMANFAHGLSQAAEDLLDPGDLPYRFQVKFSGPVGNETGLRGAYPDHDWNLFAENLVRNLGFDWALSADQDEFNLRTIRLFDTLVRINDIVVKYAQDFWDYTSRGVLTKKPKKEESGSSSMAAKVNPWRTEGGWVLLEDASEDLRRFHDLSRYKRQGDLRRSMRRRFLGDPFAKIATGINRIMQDLSKYKPVPGQIERELAEHQEMTAFYMQTVFKREGVADGYDRVKQLTMGREVSERDLHQAIDAMVSDGMIEADVGREIKEGMKPENNTGYANEWADSALSEAENTFSRLRTAYKIDQ